jgi:propionate CoA-transferase
MDKTINIENAVDLIQDGMCVVIEGFVGAAHAEEISVAVEKNFLEKGSPRELTLMHAAGIGDSKSRGANHWAHEGLLKRVIGGHYALAPKIQQLVLENKVEAYNLPQGVISQMFRDIASKKPATITTVGLKTFVDPRVEGGKISEKTTTDIVEVIQIDEKEYLKYNPQKIDIAIIRGTYADKKGNMTMEKEGCVLNALAIAQATKACGGKVIIQVEKLVDGGRLDARLVKVPGIYVDAIVVNEDAKHHMMTCNIQHDPAYTGEMRIPLSSVKRLPLTERKIIARRAAMELIPNGVINLGIGVPEAVGFVASEEGLSDCLTLTIESGPIGGVPASGLDFGCAINMECMIDQASQFDFYDGGGIDVAFLGLAQCDEKGNINVSKFGPKIAGCGGFINITQNAKKLIYCGTFSASGLDIVVDNGKLIIRNEGRVQKFIKEVEQITFSGDYALECGQPVLYITERCVFELRKEGLTLVEIAPGIDLQKDILDLMEFQPILSDNILKMDERIFKEELMKLVI